MLPEEALGVVLPDLLPRHRPPPRPDLLGAGQVEPERSALEVSERASVRACGRGQTATTRARDRCARPRRGGVYIARPGRRVRDGRGGAPAGEAAAAAGFLSVAGRWGPGWFGLVSFGCGGGWDLVGLGPFVLVR